MVEVMNLIFTKRNRTKVALLNKHFEVEIPGNPVYFCFCILFSFKFETCTRKSNALGNGFTLGRKSIYLFAKDKLRFSLQDYWL